MAQIIGRRKINVEFHLTVPESLHLFAQWMETNPKVKVEEMRTRDFQSAVRDVLAAKGWQAVTSKLPDHVELKKLDYQAALKGILA
jgi:hypothetical protein